MKIISSEIKDSSVFAELCLDKSEIIAADIPASVEAAISAHCKNAGIKPVFPRVLSIDELEDGAVQFSFDAMKMPSVKRGDYTGVRVMADRDEDILPMALAAAAESIGVELPESVIANRLDMFLVQKKVELLDNPVYGAITDVYAVLLRLNENSDEPKEPEELWRLTLESAAEHLKSGSGDLNDFMQAIKRISGADDTEIEMTVDDRIQERQFMNPEDMAGQMLSAFLEISGTTLEGWRNENRAAAEQQCRIDLLLDAVIDAEKIEVTEDEFDATLSDLALQYQMPRSDIEVMVRREALEYQVKLAKAKKLIADSAVRF